MAETPVSELEQRLGRLEQLVEELLSRTMAETSRPQPLPANPVRTEVDPAIPVGAVAASAVLTPMRQAAAPRHTPVADWRRFAWDGEFWLNKLGIGLVLFGVTFLFLYSIEQGWITPEVRVGFGAAVGVLLLGSGLRMGPTKRALAQVLLGGGIGVFYIVGFAGFQLYELLGYNVAFACMVAVTLLAFGLAVREDHPILALIGIKGALGTPFLLYRGDGDVVWLASYAALVVASSVALFLHRDWRSLVWTAALGGWAVHVIAYAQSFAPAGSGTNPERWMVQGTIVFAWALFALVVPAWENRSASAASRSKPTSAPVMRAHLHLLAVLTAVAALAISAGVWDATAATWGWVVLAAGAAYLLAAAILRSRARAVADAQLFAASVLIPIGSVAAVAAFAAFRAEVLYSALALQALLFHVLARRWPSGWLRVVGHFLVIALAIWFIVRLEVSGLTGTVRALADPLVIAAALLAARELNHPVLRGIYRGAVHLAILAWLWRELVVLPSGAALVSGAWGGYAVMLMAIGAWRREPALQKVAIATILAVVAKLFLIDLAALEAIWRILLFLGLGSVLLVSSYALQGLWRAPGLEADGSECGVASGAFPMTR